jgi:DNA (cytosine-5)-methyltransferase 1
MNYYNDNDPKAARWLEELVKEKLIPNGHVDSRSITDVSPRDLAGYIQCHFFAGIGGWPLAFAIAGWPEDRPGWSASCPCPPFSAAGKKKLCPECGGKPIPHPLKTGIFACVPCGHEWPADGRHLYPELFRLASECKPPVIIGEQVSGPDGLIWLAGVRSTLEALGYAFGGLDTCAAGIGAPHIRQRLYWVANSMQPGRSERGAITGDGPIAGSGGANGGLAHAPGPRCERALSVPEREAWDEARMLLLGENGGHGGLAYPEGDNWRREQQESGERRGRRGLAGSGRLVHALSEGLEGYAGNGDNGNESRRIGESEARPVAAAGDIGGMGLADSDGCGPGSFAPTSAGYRGAALPASVWTESRLILCRDGKVRRIPVEPAFFPLADGLSSARVGILRASGNAIVPQVAAEVVRSYLELK